MIIGIDKGHTIEGNKQCGAVGFLNESRENREVGNRVIDKLRELGHTVIDCSCNAANSVNEQLAAVVQKANAQKLDLMCSLHLNAGGGTGVEVYTTNTSGAKTVAKRVLDTYISKTGFKNRGHKYAEFYVLRHTIAPAFLIEMCFVDTQVDKDRWDSLSYSTIVNAIVEGILGQKVPEKPVENPIKPPSSNINKTILSVNSANEWVTRLQKELNVQGFKDYNGAALVTNGYPGKCTLSACERTPLKYGSKGNITKLVQEMLNKLGYNTNGIDGSFGPGMKSAVEQYQRDWGLTIDGSFGPQCYKAILGM